ncbi:MAG: hypothetical protein Q9170_002805 [Blastenia crenularia]
MEPKKLLTATTAELKETNLASLPHDAYEVLHEHGLELVDAFVTWKTGNKNHPRNWSTKRKVYDTAIMLFLQFFTTVVSTSGTPASSYAYKEFDVSLVKALFAFTSMYLFGQAVGALLFPPFSETLGRKVTFIGSTLLFSIFCILAAISDLRTICLGRFLSGMLSAVPAVVAAGSIQDIWDMKGRIWVIFAWQAMGIIGLAVGPITATYLTTSSLGWKWNFYIAAMVMGCAFSLSLGMRESRPSRLLKVVVSRITKEKGYELSINDPDRIPSVRAYVETALIRPIRLFFTEPIVFCASIMSAFVFALIFLFAEAFPIVYRSSPFNFTFRQSSLVFIAIGLGVLLGIPLRMRDRKMLATRQKNGRDIPPEAKLVGFYIAAPTLAIALWWTSWSVPPYVHVHWIVSVLPLALIGFSANEFDSALAGYLTDSYTIYAGSANAPLACLRALLSGVFPLFAKQMFDRLGANVAGSVLGVLATLFCVTPFVFARYGKWLRLKSKFARYSLEAAGEV